MASDPVATTTVAAGSRAEGCLLYDGVTFAYSGGKEQTKILGDVSLKIFRGEFVAVVGPSGCGKSTLLRLAAGLLLPTAGGVFVEGQHVLKPTPRVGVVFQHDTLLPWRTARRNVELALEGHRKRAEIRRRSTLLLEKVGLADAADRYPHQLSGGMRQRVNLARAMANDPDILLMDEPFASLDAQTREEQQRELLRVWREDQKTVMFVTHQIEEAVFLADRILVMGRAPRGIVKLVPVPLDRPRGGEIRTSLEFNRIAHEIRVAISAERGDGDGGGDEAHASAGS